MRERAASVGIGKLLETEIDARGSVDDRKGRESLPSDGRVVGRARNDVGVEKGPGERLWDPNLIRCDQKKEVSERSR